VRQVVGWLGKEYLRPLGIEADRQHAPLSADHPFFVTAIKKGLTGGFTGKVKDWDKPARKDDGRARRTARRAVVLGEEAAYWDRGMATMLPGPGLGGAPVMFTGTPEQKKRFLGPFQKMRTPMWAAFGMSEPDAGSDVARIRTRAVRDGDEFVLNGEKCFISNGDRAAFTVIWATIDPSLGRAGHRPIVVEAGTPGFHVAKVERKMGLAASATASLVLQDCRVPVANLLGGEAAYASNEGFKSAMKTFNMTRPIVAAMAVGIGRACFDETQRFAKTAFTGPSAWRMDRVRDRLAHVRRRLECGRLLAWKAAWQADHRQDNAVAAAIAKATCAQIAFEAASMSLDVLGEAGGAGDELIEKLYRDVKALDIVEGTGQIQRIVIARRLIGLGKAPPEATHA